MKKLLPATAIIIFLLVISDAFAKPKITSEIKQSTVESLMNGLKSENLGLQNSSVYMIGELKLAKALIPLLKILHSEKNEEIRISAALALYKIGSPIAIYAVKQAVRFDDSERVSKLCASFYNEFLKNKFYDMEISKVAAKTASK
jgi:hypothetical protein